MKSNNNNIQMALTAIKASRWRSFLTMLGVIIGVTSVVTVVSLGEGVKQQLNKQIQHTGTDLITIRGGRVATRDSKGRIDKVNLPSLFASANLSEADYQSILKIPDLTVVAPFASVPGVAKASNSQIETTSAIVATNHKGAQALNQNVLYGDFFGEKDQTGAVAVIGKTVAEELFKENVPVGKSFELRGQKIIVRGIFQEFESSPLGLGLNYNNTIFIPYEYAKQLAGGSLQPYQILIRSSETQTVDSTINRVTTTLRDAHGGQTDFTVLQASDNIALASSALNFLTGLVSAVAAVSLVVGGIGIMNIMFVAVSERTHEVGIRKSVGATNHQILNQFMIEAVVLSGLGGIFGVLASLLVNYFLRIFTSLQPVITLPIMIIAVSVALVVGVIFGSAPALKAARKDPIEALRRT
jgi:putative ABC transport system permease protein